MILPASSSLQRLEDDDSISHQKELKRSRKMIEVNTRGSRIRCQIKKVLYITNHKAELVI